MMDKQLDFLVNVCEKTVLCELYFRKKRDFAQSSRNEVPINIGDDNYKILTAFTYLRINRRKNLKSDFKEDKKFEMYAHSKI